MIDPSTSQSLPLGGSRMEDQKSPLDRERLEVDLNNYGNYRSRLGLRKLWKGALGCLVLGIGVVLIVFTLSLPRRGTNPRLSPPTSQAPEPCTLTPSSIRRMLECAKKDL